MATKESKQNKSSKTTGNGKTAPKEKSKGKSRKAKEVSLPLGTKKYEFDEMSQFTPNRYQMRLKPALTEDFLKTLKKHAEVSDGVGNIEAITANKNGDIIVGNTRWAGIMQLGLRILVHVVDVTEEEAWRMSAASNIARTDLNTIEEIITIQKLIQLGDEQKEIRKSLGMNGTRCSVLFRIAETFPSESSWIEKFQELEITYTDLREAVVLRNDDLMPLEKSRTMILKAFQNKIEKELDSKLFSRYCSITSELSWLITKYFEVDPEEAKQFSERSKVKTFTKGAYVDELEKDAQNIYLDIIDKTLELPKLEVLKIKELKTSYDKLNSYEKKYHFISQTVGIEKKLWMNRIELETKARDTLQKISIIQGDHKKHIREILENEIYELEINKKKLSEIGNKIDKVWSDYYDAYLKECSKYPSISPCVHVDELKCSKQGSKHKEHHIKCGSCHITNLYDDSEMVDKASDVKFKPGLKPDVREKISGLLKEIKENETLSAYQALKQIVKSEKPCAKSIKCQHLECTQFHECEIAEDHITDFLVDVDIAYCTTEKDFFNSQSRFKPKQDWTCNECEEMFVKDNIAAKINDKKKSGLCRSCYKKKEVELESEKAEQATKSKDEKEEKEMCTNCSERPQNVKNSTLCYPCSQEVKTGNSESEIIEAKPCIFCNVLTKEIVGTSCTDCIKSYEFLEIDYDKYVERFTKSEIKIHFLNELVEYSTSIFINRQEFHDLAILLFFIKFREISSTQQFIDKLKLIEFDPKSNIPKVNQIIESFGYQVGCANCDNLDFDVLDQLYIINDEILCAECYDILRKRQKSEIDWDKEVWKITDETKSDAFAFTYTTLSFDPENLFLQVGFIAGPMKGIWKLDLSTISKFHSDFRNKSRSSAFNWKGIELERGSQKDWEKAMKETGRSYWSIRKTMQDKADEKIEKFEEFLTEYWGSVVVADTRTVVVHRVDNTLEIYSCEMSNMSESYRRLSKVKSFKLSEEDRR